MSQRRLIMLSDYPIVAALPASDVGRARKFYEDTLGLKPNAVAGNEEALFPCGDGTASFVTVRRSPGPTRRRPRDGECPTSNRRSSSFAAREFGSTSTTCPASRPRTGSRFKPMGPSCLVHRYRRQHPGHRPTRHLAANGRGRANSKSTIGRRCRLLNCPARPLGLDPT